MTTGIRMHRVTSIVADAHHHRAVEPGERDFSVLKITAFDSKGGEVEITLFLAQEGRVGREMSSIYAKAINDAARDAALLTAIPVETVVEGEAA